MNYLMKAQQFLNGESKSQSPIGSQQSTVASQL